MNDKRKNTYNLQLKQKKYDFDIVKKYVYEILKLDTEKRLAVSGGIVPYLVCNTPSNRQHENIDFLCEIKDIEYFRNYFINELKFKLLGDSLNNKKGDYGFVFLYKGIPVGIYPYYLENNTILEKNYYYYSNDQFIREIKNMDINSFIFTKDNVRYQSLNVILKKKLYQNRPKDQKDIEILLQCGASLENAQKIQIEEIE